MVEKDAKERAENRRLRKEKSDVLKDEGIKLFRKGDYASALSKFNKVYIPQCARSALITANFLEKVKLPWNFTISWWLLLQAIEWTKDSPLLYNNRALTYIRLKIYSKAIEDCDKTLHLSENNIKARLYKAKALYMSGDVPSCRKLLEEAREMNADSEKIIARKPFQLKITQGVRFSR